MLAEAADVQGHKADDANYWQLLGAKLLSVLLFAAAGTGRSMADVARWVDVQDVDDVAQALMEIGNQQALDAWAACTSRPDNTMGSVYGTAETLLDVFGDPTIAASAEGCDLDIDELLTGANNTLYLYAPASEQERLRPLFELLVSVVIYKAEQLAAAQPGGMLDPRLFVCLDEAGNCAAIKKLPQLATTGRGQGIQLLTIWHDEAQLQHRYGHRASTVLNGHRAKLLLSGQADPASLELASKLVGDEAVIQTSETTGGDGRASLTESTAYRRLLPPEALRQLKPRRALLVYGHLPPVRIRLRPWFRSRRLVTLAMAVDAAVPHPAMRSTTWPPSRCCGRPTRARRPPDAAPSPTLTGNGTRPVSPARRPATPASGPAASGRWRGVPAGPGHPAAGGGRGRGHRLLLLCGLGHLAVRPGGPGRLQLVAGRRRPGGGRRAGHLRHVPDRQPLPPRRQGRRLWLAAGQLRHPGLDRRQRRPRPTQPGRPGHRRRHPPGRAGHAGRPQGRRRRGHPPGRPGRRPETARARSSQPGQLPQATTVRRSRPHRQPGHRGGGLGSQRRALPAGPEPTDGRHGRGAAAGRLCPTAAGRPALDGPHPGRGRRLWPQQRRQPSCNASAHRLRSDTR